MLKKYTLLLALGLIGPAYSHTSSSSIKTACIVAGAAGAATLTYKAYGHWLVKRVQSHFSYARNLLNQYANYSAQTQSWTALDLNNLLQDLKIAIIQQHNINAERWDISIAADIYNAQPAMYVNSTYRNFPLLQCIDDINWYLSHLKAIRFMHLHPHREEITLLIDQLTYIKHLIFTDHAYTQEAAMLNAAAHR